MATFRVPVLETFAWQEPVLLFSDGTTPAPVATKGNRYIATGTGGAFAGIVGLAAGDIVWYDDTAWVKDTPAEGWKTYNLADGAFYVFDGTTWTSASVMDGLTIKGDIDSTETEIDWDLLDENANALTFMTHDEIAMLNFNTVTGNEALELGSVVDLEMNGGDINLNAGTTVNLSSDAAALDVYSATDSTSALTINGTTSLATFGSDVVVQGDLLVQGATTTIETAELVVQDQLITLNNGGNNATAIGSGIEFEGTGGVIDGSIKTSTDGFVFDPVGAANDGNTLTLDLDAATTITMAGNLDVEAASAIDQDLTVDSSTVQFAGLALTGDIDLSTQATGIDLAAATANALNIESGLLTLSTDTNTVATTGNVDITGNLAVDGNFDLTAAATIIQLRDNTDDSITFDSVNQLGILAIDTNDGTEGVTMSGTLDVTGAVDFASTLTFPAAAAAGGTEYITDGAASTNVAQMERSYDSRAQYDTVLNVMRFVDPDTYVA